MTVEEELARLSAKVEEYRQKDAARASRDKYIQLSFIFWAFAIVTTSFMVSLPNLRNIFMAIVFYAGGAASLVYSRRFKV